MVRIQQLMMCIFFLVMLVIPVVAHGQTPLDPGGGLITCGRDTNGDNIITAGGVDADGNELPDEQCHFEDVVISTQRVINWLLAFSVFLAAILFSWAGFLYVTSGGDPGQVQRAHSIFRNVVIGFVLALSGWLLVSAVLTGLGARDGFILLQR